MCAAFQDRLARLFGVGQDLGVDMDHHLVPRPRGTRIKPLMEGRLYTLLFGLPGSVRVERHSEEEWFLIESHAVRAAAAACGPLGRYLHKAAAA